MQKDLIESVAALAQLLVDTGYVVISLRIQSAYPGVVVVSAARASQQFGVATVSHSGVHRWQMGSGLWVSAVEEAVRQKDFHSEEGSDEVG